jgi:integrase
VPIHSQIVEWGFLDFVAKRREEEPEGYLFSGVIRNKNGNRADSVGKWWAALVIKILGPSRPDWPQGSRGIHSFRHSWVAAARTAEIPEDIWERITGHSSGNKVSRRYGRHDELAMLKAAIDKIEFPNVDFSALLPPKADQ